MGMLEELVDHAAMLRRSGPLPLVRQAIVVMPRAAAAGACGN